MDRMWDRLDPATKAAYTSGNEKVLDAVKEASNLLIELSGSTKTYLVSDAMVHALTSVRPQVRYEVGLDAKLFWLRLPSLPTFILDFLLKLGVPKIK